MTVGILLLLKAFASGSVALTGVEAIANAVPEFREPRARRAQHTEVGLGVILGLMLIGIAVVADKFKAEPSKTVTTLAQLTQGALGHNFVFYAVQLITTVLLALAANTSFGGLPVLASLLATDNYLPHLFFLRAQRQVHRYGVVVLAIFAAILLVVTRGDTQALTPLFAIGVFVGFTLSQTGMVRHWRRAGRIGLAGPCRHQRRRRAVHAGRAGDRADQQVHRRRLAGRDRGAAAGADVQPGAHDLPAHRRRPGDRAGAAAAGAPHGPGRRPGRQHVQAGAGGDLRCPVARRRGRRGDRLLRRRRGPREADERLREQWEQWHPDVPLVTLHSKQRSLGQPIVDYLRDLERGSEPRSAGGADPRGAGGASLAADPAQPARLRARAGDPARHGERGDLPAALPAVHGRW